MERHYVTTSDGYILCLHRLVAPRLRNSVKRTLKPILIQHGLLASSLSWVMNSNENDYENFDAESLVRDLFLEDNIKIKPSSIHNSLAFTLIDQGYDVWLGNSRGNSFSTNHTFLDAEKDQLYWSFSFHEMATYDLPAMIEYILANNEHQHLGYVGHSQGALIMFALMSQNSRITKLIKPFVALAPVTYLKSVYSGRFASLVRLVDTRTLSSTYVGSVLRHRPRIANQLNRICTFRIVAPLCMAFLRLLNVDMSTTNQTTTIAYPQTTIDNNNNNNSVQVNRATVPVSAAYSVTQNSLSSIPDWVIQNPAGTSFLNILHYIQMAQTGVFAAFDFGSEEANLRRYGRRRPPIYDLSRINSSDIIMVSGLLDLFAHPEDVGRLKKSLKGNYLSIELF